MKTIYNWNSETGAVETTTVETKSVQHVCRVLAKHGPGELADRFIGMACIETGYEEAEAAWYRIQHAMEVEAAADDPDETLLADLAEQRGVLEDEHLWLAGYRGEEAPEPPAPIYADKAAFVEAHWRCLREAAYGSIGGQMGMQYDDARDGTTIWVDHCAAVKAAFPKPAA